MRRSAAPSQAGRPKFVAPFQQPKVNCSIEGNKDCSTTLGKDQVKENTVLKRIFSNTSVDSQDENSNIQADSVAPVAKKSRFDPPTVRKTGKPTFSAPMSSQTQSVGHVEKQDSSTASLSGYFNVVWCKRSNKKHKKWEGDAVLVTTGRSAVLYDTEGKEIGKSSGYKSTDLSSLKEDETLPLGGKEIQVMSVITGEDFTSGKCFTGANAVVTPSILPDRVPTKVSSKPFAKPLKSTSENSSPLPRPEPTVVKPRYDPTVPGALVMPRPSDSHQWKWNKKGLSVVDVVVDPYLACHLRPHQREGVTFLYECIMGYRSYAGYGAILADDMGLGKTLQCISLLWTLYKQGPYGGKPIVKRILIITPGSLVKNWYHEFKKWLGFERLQVYAVSSDKKVEDFMKTSIYPVLIISYEMFVRMYSTLQQITFDVIVCDEGHRLKNTAIKTTSLIMSLLCQRRVVLTGTPIQNDLQEFFSIVEFCNPGVLGSSAAFHRVYEKPIVCARQPKATPTETSLGEERGAELARMTKMFVLRRTQEINNKYLPPKCEIIVFCRPTSLQLRLYQQLLRCQLIRSCLSGQLSGSPHLICIGALKQLVNHPRLIHKKCLAEADARYAPDDGMDRPSSVYDGLLPLFPESYPEDSQIQLESGKLSVLSCLLHKLHISGQHDKIVVVSNHTKTLDVIQGMCDIQTYKYLRLDGQTPTAKRQELVQRFNSKHGQEFIFLLSSKAGGVGLNLIGASRLVLYDIDWNPANDLQVSRIIVSCLSKTLLLYMLTFVK